MEVDIEGMLPADAKAKLFAALQGKKVLLLLDDVWDDGVPVLDSLDVTSGINSNILVTTRHVKVRDKIVLFLFLVVDWLGDFLQPREYARNRLSWKIAQMSLIPPNN